MHDRVLRTLACLGLLLVCATLTLKLSGASAPWQSVATFSSLAVIGVLLANALLLSRRTDAGIGSTDRRLMQLHVLAHSVPICFGLATLLNGSSGRLSATWICAFGLFFYTGRRTWRALHAARPSPVYFVFLRGNTAMLASSAFFVLLAVATASQAPLGFLGKLYLTYTVIHLILLGPAVAKIDRDLGAD